MFDLILGNILFDYFQHLFMIKNNLEKSKNYKKEEDIKTFKKKKKKNLKKNKK